MGSWSMRAVLLAAAGSVFLGLATPGRAADDFPTDQLPPPTGTLDAEQPFTFGGTPVVFSDLSLRLPTTCVSPPAPGTSSAVQFEATARLRASNNNGATFQPVSCTAVVSMSLTTTADGSACDAEIQALSLSGGGLPPAIRLRESPTLASLGRFSIERCSDGTCRISSFFDIFTELSTNGGGSWAPSNGAVHCTGGAPSCEIPAATTDLLPPACAHRDRSLNSWQSITTPSLKINSLTVSDALSSVQPPALGAPPVDLSTQATLSGEMSLDGGVSFQRFSCPVALVVRLTCTMGGTTSSFCDTEVLSLSAAGATLPSGVMVRESPTKASTGRTSVRQCPDGSCRISSFFDIFTEVSLDAGATWSDSSAGPVVCALSRDHFFSTDVFPPPADYACDASSSVSFGTTGVVLSDFRYRPSDERSPWPAVGSSEPRLLGGTTSCRVARPGSTTCCPGLPTNTGSTSDFVLRSSSGGDPTMECLELSFSTGGPDPVMVRESPTKASLGRTRVCSCPSGYMVNSFFDIFLEVSLDGGSSWTPADSSLRLSLLPYVEQDCVFSSAYPFPRDGVFEERPSAIVASLTKDYLIRKLSMRATTKSTNPLYEGGQTSENPLFSTCDCEVSLDGGATWVPVSGPATGAFSVSRVTHEDTWDQQSVFDMEMTSFAVLLSSAASGGLPPVSLRLRESPTRASLGRTSVQRLSDGTSCRLDSFFDIFTEISLDDGMTWLPAASASHLELHDTPDECPVSSDWLPLAVSLQCPDPAFKIKPNRPSSAATMRDCVRALSFDNGACALVVAGGAVPPPAPGSSVTCTSTVPVSFDYSADGGSTFQRVSCDALVTCVYTRLADGSLSCEMLSCAVAGGSLAPDLRLRESPTLPSRGQTRVQPPSSSSSRCVVSSFFDIFLEISHNSGTTWSPVCTPVRVESCPTPHGLLSSSSTELPLSRLVCPTGPLPPDCVNEVRVGSVTLTPRLAVAATPVARPVPGGKTSVLGEATVDLQVSTDDGQTFSPAHADAFFRYELKEVMVDSVQWSCTNEMLQLEISGGSLPTGVMVRESPTRASLGRTRVRESPTLPSGSYCVSSFFDIFVECSIDGGKTWKPCDLPLHFEFEDALESSGTPDNSWPPPGQFSRLSGDPDFDTAFTNGASLSFFDIFTELGVARPPLPTTVGESLDTNTNGRCHLHVSRPAGDPEIDADCDISCTIRLTATGTFSDGTSSFDTEMLGLALAGTGLPPGVALRESPSKQSLGKTSIRVSAAGGGGGGAGGFLAESFFDIFLDLSLDGGTTWCPCDRPVRVSFTSPEIDVTTGDGAAISDGTQTVTVNASITSTLSLDVVGIVVHNTGSAPLTGIHVTIDGPDAGLFEVTSPPAGTLPPGGGTAFKVGLASPTPGPRSATLHILCNDADEASFDIPLSARALAPDADDDGDGLTNGHELALAGCGFDPLADSSSQTDVFRDNGFFLASDMHAMALGRPVLERDAATGHFHLQLAIRESPTLQTWSSLTGFSATCDPGTGVIDLDIAPSSSSQRFFQVLGDAP